MADTAQTTPNPTDLGPDSAEPSFGDKVRSAVIWRSGTQILGQVVAWASTFFVIRILTPEDYGLVAMTGVISLLLSLVNGYGFASALIQRKDVTPHMLRQLFGMLVLMNAGLAAAQLLAAPYVAAYFGEPMVARLLQVQALLYPTTPFIVLAYTILSREMDFRRQARVNFVSAIVAALSAVAGALLGWGVWTLVIAPLLGLYIRAIGLTVAARAYIWPSFDFRGAGFIARFGGLVLVSQLFWFLQSQADIFIVGRYYSAAELGIYSTALFLTQVFLTKVVPPLNEVAFSAYSRIMDEDRAAVASAFLRSVQLIMLVGLPVFAGFAVTAEPLVLTVLGEKWAGTVPFVILLAIAMPLKTMLTLYVPAANAIDRADIPLKNGLAGALVMPAAFFFALQWGLIGVAWAWIAGFALVLAICSWITLPALGVRLRDLARAIAPALAASALMAAAVLGLDALVAFPAQWLRLAALVMLGAATYAAGLLLFARQSTMDVLRLVLKRKVAAPVTA
ncbi:lipopolysaccharide biosynthesis protein [Alteriqipengyuania sp. WL0013]|uniref:lipopolysaccharide biosynthesis protein n=1 Tax=Alteriqipengyuania sp. WL0013 TaxID=3110773 RepID=UPI002CCE1E20|nr:lipopolysaccharide biosynthesis protein [Alteriqipengyuania sp. WL0013]MEB3416794.1 lipopolysaccharide biosynthesis protein [Alteriqipengyuania sp. WL0013]